jgi:uncharacterized protein YoxC
MSISVLISKFKSKSLSKILNLYVKLLKDLDNFMEFTTDEVNTINNKINELTADVNYKKSEIKKAEKIKNNITKLIEED